MDSKQIAQRHHERESAKAKAEIEAARNRRIAQAWDAWISSEQGEKCLREEGCYGEYLRNRLWHAFIAGAGAANDK